MIYHQRMKFNYPAPNKPLNSELASGAVIKNHRLISLQGKNGKMSTLLIWLAQSLYVIKGIEMINILRWLLGFVSIIFVATTLPFAMNNPEIENQWLMVALSIPNIIVIGWFMAEARELVKGSEWRDPAKELPPPVGSG